MLAGHRHLTERIHLRSRSHRRAAAQEAARHPVPVGMVALAAALVRVTLRQEQARPGRVITARMAPGLHTAAREAAAQAQLVVKAPEAQARQSAALAALAQRRRSQDHRSLTLVAVAAVDGLVAERPARLARAAEAVEPPRERPDREMQTAETVAALLIAEPLALVDQES